MNFWPFLFKAASRYELGRRIILLGLPFKKKKKDFPGGSVVKNLPTNAGDTGSSRGPGRSHMPRSN